MAEPTDPREHSAVPDPMHHPSSRAPTLDDLRRTADRCDELAQTAELMGDEAGAARLRDTAQLWRMRAMHLLDEGG